MCERGGGCRRKGGKGEKSKNEDIGRMRRRKVHTEIEGIIEYMETADNELNG